MWRRWECRAVLLLAKASVTAGGLEESLPWTPRGLRERHDRKEQEAKARNHSRVAGALPHGVGIAYKPLYGEIAVCLRVGRMGPIKC